MAPSGKGHGKKLCLIKGITLVCYNMASQLRLIDARQPMPTSNSFMSVSSATHRLPLHQVGGGAEVRDGLSAGAVYLQGGNVRIGFRVFGNLIFHNLTEAQTTYSVQCTVCTVH